MQLNPEVVKVWRINFSIRFLFYLVITFGLESFFHSNIMAIVKFPFGSITFILLTLFVLFLIIMPKLIYKNWDFSFEESEMVIKKGVITKINITVPYNRIQHLDIVQGFIERSFELSTLVIHTAGSRSSGIYIPGLPHYYSEQMRDFLKKYIKDEEF